mmetsp:Transcript_15139/g.21183  ORF Transcript_15139/g.21183 Transcript_15139/m.21183 type:complete len:95 (+) Transcript_15139:616-900(+)
MKAGPKIFVKFDLQCKFKKKLKLEDSSAMKLETPKRETKLKILGARLRVFSLYDDVQGRQGRGRGLISYNDAGRISQPERTDLRGDRLLPDASA